MAIADIQAMYDKLYSSKYNDLVKNKQSSLDDLANQETTTNSTYQDLLNSLNSKKAQTQAQYKDLYTGLDNKQATGQQEYLNQRDQAAVGNTNNMQQIRDYMANHNLLTSGESADALMREVTNYRNNLGTVTSGLNNFNKGIGDQRSQYNLAEQNAYQDIGNQLSAADRDKAANLAKIYAQRTNINSQFAGDEQALKDSIEAQRIKDINDYNTMLQQQQFQAQQNALARAASAAKSSSSASNTKDKQDQAQQNKIDSTYTSELNKVMTMKKSTTRVYDEDTGRYVNVPKYSDDEIINYIQGLKLPEDYIYNLLDASGLEAPTTEPNKLNNNTADAWAMLRG